MSVDRREKRPKIKAWFISTLAGEGGNSFIEEKNKHSQWVERKFMRGVMSWKPREKSVSKSNWLHQILLTDQVRWGLRTDWRASNEEVTQDFHESSYRRKTMVKAWSSVPRRRGGEELERVNIENWVQRILLKGMRELKWLLKREVDLKGFVFVLFSFLLLKREVVAHYGEMQERRKTSQCRRKHELQEKAWIAGEMPLNGDKG